MTALHTTKRMTVAEFLEWAEGQPGRHELWNGQPIAMSPETLRHAEIKGEIFVALRNAIRRAGLDCRAVTDGMTVRIDDETAFEPDALVYCGDRPPGDTLAIAQPVIIVEVTSTSTKHIDSGMKLEGYFRLPSVMHYLILSATNKTITHHARKDGVIETAIIRSGEVRLAPPGIAFDLGEAFGLA